MNATKGNPDYPSKRRETTAEPDGGLYDGQIVKMAGRREAHFVGRVGGRLSFSG